MKRLLVGIGGIILVAVAFAVTLFFMRMNDQQATPEQTANSESGSKPALSVKKVIDNLTTPWEVAFLPDSTMLFTERSGTISVVSNEEPRELVRPADVVARGEGGMLGLAVDPEFTDNRFIYACFNSSQSTSSDVRVVRWKLSEENDGVSERKDILTGMPSNESGRHSGCRIGFGPDEKLWVGTGDAADESQPQNQASLGGKILRVDREGQAASDNPTGTDKRIFSYGHRNVQGLAFYSEQAQNGSYGVSVEHGPSQDDEVNELVTGNFGWGPGQGYDESVDMTDSDRFPGSIESIWSSGDPTIAPSDADFIQGSEWENWQGWLAMGVLKDKHLRLIKFENGKTTRQIEVLKEELGRIRAVSLGPDNALYLSTDNGSNDAIYTVTLQKKS